MTHWRRWNKDKELRQDLMRKTNSSRLRGRLTRAQGNPGRRAKNRCLGSGWGQWKQGTKHAAGIKKDNLMLHKPNKALSMCSHWSMVISILVSYCIKHEAPSVEKACIRPLPLEGYPSPRKAVGGRGSQKHWVFSCSVQFKDLCEVQLSPSVCLGLYFHLLLWRPIYFTLKEYVCHTRDLEPSRIQPACCWSCIDFSARTDDFNSSTPIHMIMS